MQPLEVGRLRSVGGRKPSCSTDGGHCGFHRRSSLTSSAGIPMVRIPALVLGGYNRGRIYSPLRRAHEGLRRIAILPAPSFGSSESVQRRAGSSPERAPLTKAVLISVRQIPALAASSNRLIFVWRENALRENLVSASVALCAGLDFLGRRDRTINALNRILRALAALEREPKHRPHDPQYGVDRPVRVAPLAQPVQCRLRHLARQFCYPLEFR